ncbi:MAG: gliding motility-associated ABC transporter substrate-binding protein GldG [Bacteroidales bacterium]|nr:gliding motility-associated ABC transporter substrate-binding protein GldG [Bacteroidales bacterium]
MSHKKINQKYNSLIRLALGLVIIVFINIIAAQLYTRIDLTAEKRYTISENTREMLSQLDDIVFFQVYLEGDLAPRYKRLQKATREMLDEFRVYSDKVQFEFINPSTTEDPKERYEVHENLKSRGIIPAEIRQDDAEGVKFQLIFPGAIISYRSKELPLQLLRPELGASEDEMVNRAIENIEYNLAYAIKLLTNEQKPKIAFIEGHGELNQIETADISRALSENYIVERVRLNERVNVLTERVESDSTQQMIIRNKFKAIIIADPDSVFSEKDKFIIDQYIMHGGKVLWLVDPVFASMDSLQFGGATMGITNNIHLDDQLFKYGVRLNTDLIMDLMALPIPVTTGSVAGKPQFDFFPWYFFPLVSPQINHPVVSNLNAVMTNFVSSIDTIRIPDVKKTFLLHSSPYARRMNAPVYINLDIMGLEPDQNLYNEQFIPVAVLLEGQFSSLYTNRLAPSLAYSKEIGFVEKSKPTSMIVVADGNIIRNQLHYRDGYALPLGYDQYTDQTFGNKKFILNAVDYLTEGSEIISIRSRNIQLRLLDNTRLKGNEVMWKLINVAVPPLLVILFGIIYIIIRKKRFTAR